jgi:hypothetical protein
MSAWMLCSQAGARIERATGLFRRRLMSRSDVKRTPCACLGQSRQLMCGGSA